MTLQLALQLVLAFAGGIALTLALVEWRNQRRPAYASCRHGIPRSQCGDCAYDVLHDNLK